MEFACGFVYVPPSANERGVQSTNPHVIKRSALLPPINRVRPRTPPPPPPTHSTEPNRPKTLPPAQKFFQHVCNEEVTKDAKPSMYENAAFHLKTGAGSSDNKTQPSPMYENAAFHLKTGAGSSENKTHELITPPRKTALLPPHMRPSANNKSLPYSRPLPSPTPNTDSQTFTYDLPKVEPDTDAYPSDSNYSYNIPECSGGEAKSPIATSVSTQKTAPALPPRPSFMKSVPEYLLLLPPSPSSTSSSSSQKAPSSPTSEIAPTGSSEGPLPGNPNVILVSLGKLVSEENVVTIEGEPTTCSQCGSVLDSCYDNVVKECYFCQSWEPTEAGTAKPRCPQNGCQDSLFLLSPDENLLSPDDTLLLFCIDISGSMSITSEVSEGGQLFYRSRLQFVQESVLQCVQKLTHQQPHARVGLITFNNQVTIHGYEEFTSRFLVGAELIDSEYLKKAAFSFPSPPPLSRTKNYLHRHVLGLSECGATALGPAALIAIAMASRQPGSKVIICTDGKANTELGNLEVEDSDARTLLSSTIFYQDLGEYAAKQGVTVSVMSIEGTDCRLDELGRLADRTGGTVVIASPHKLWTEFEEIIENRTIATHCGVTLLLPQTLRVMGERVGGHKGTREVGNVALEKEITFQFGAKDGDSEASPPTSGSNVSIQLQIRYRQRDGRRMLRVLTEDRDVTDDSSSVLSSLSLAIIQLNSSQASAALAVRGRFQDAKSEGELQRQLMERALEHNRSAEDEETYEEWIKTMEPIYNDINNYTRRMSVISDTKSLTDTGAALLYNMKHSNRKTIKNRHITSSFGILTDM